MTDLPPVRGTLTPGRPLADLTWLRVGGPADWLFQPADRDDLAAMGVPRQAIPVRMPAGRAVTAPGGMELQIVLPGALPDREPCAPVDRIAAVPLVVRGVAARPDLIAIGAYQRGNDAATDEALERWPEIMEFLGQDVAKAADLPHSQAALQRLVPAA